MQKAGPFWVRSRNAEPCRTSFIAPSFSCLPARWGAAVSELPPLRPTTGALRTWNYALQTDPSGVPSRALAQVRGEEGSSLWLSCTRVAGGEGDPPQAAVAVTVMQKAYLGPSDPKGRSTVYWLDDRPPEVSHWIYRDRYGQLRGEDQVMGFVASLATAQTPYCGACELSSRAAEREIRSRSRRDSGVAERFSKDCRSIATAKD